MTNQPNETIYQIIYGTFIIIMGGLVVLGFLGFLEIVYEVVKDLS